MDILYVSPYFPPEMGAPAARVHELARHWVRAGHEVTVLTGFPNQPTGEVPREYRSKMRRLVYREQVDGIHVVRTWLLPLPNRKAYERILNYSSFFLSSCLTGTFLHRPDVIIATSPQPLTGLTGWWLARIKRRPYVFEVRDLWPESLTGIGLGTENSPHIRSLRALPRFLYRSSDHVVVVSPAFKEELVGKWGIAPEKISLVENGVETDLFTPDGATDAAQQALGVDDRFVVSYIGTLGLAHGLDVVLRAAAQLQRTLPKILFLFVGEGAEKERLVSRVRTEGLANVRFLPQQPRERVSALIRGSHVCLVLLRKAEVFKTVIPTKALEFMACGRPVVLGVDGEARRLLEEAQAGLFVEPENSTALAEGITRLYNSSQLRKTLGDNGRRYILENLSRERTAQIYTGVLEKVILNRKRRRAA